jgi:hypothetical protein
VISNSCSDKRFCYRQTSPDTRNKRKKTQLYNATTICLGLGGRKKHTHTTDKLFLQVQTSVGGATAPSALTPPSAESDPASDSNTVGGSPPRRKMSTPRLGHRRQGLLQEPGPSRRLDRPLRSLSQLSPEDISLAHGFGRPTPGLVLLVDNLARFQLPLHASSAWEVTCSWANEVSSRANSASVHAHTAASGSGSSQSSRGFSLTEQEKPRAARPIEPRDSYASRIRISHSSPSARGNSHLVKRSS